MDRVASDVNTIRTVLPNSHREAAHSPPRNQGKSVDIQPKSPARTINPIPTIVTVDCTSPTLTPPTAATEKSNPKMIKDPFSNKYFHRNSDGIFNCSTSEPADSTELHSTSVPRNFLILIFLFHQVNI